MVVCLVLVILLTLGCSFSATPCSDGFEPHHGSCYFFSHDQETWIGAYDTCKLFGAMLVEIESADEDAFTSAKARTLGNYWWMGLTDKLIEGEYTWATSKEVLAADSFSNWGSGEPNGAADEDCVLYAPSRNYQWADADCNRKEHYICEKRAESNEIIG